MSTFTDYFISGIECSFTIKNEVFLFKANVTCLRLSFMRI